MLLPSLPTHRALTLTGALQHQVDFDVDDDCEEDIRARLVKYLKGCEVGQVEAAPRLELAELVQLLSHLIVTYLDMIVHRRSDGFDTSPIPMLTCLVPPIAFELFFLYLDGGW